MNNQSVIEFREQIRAVLQVQSTPTAEAKILALELLKRRSAEKYVELQADYELFLDLLEVRHKLTGLGHALEGLREIILSCFCVCRAGDEVAEEVITSFSLFVEDVKESPWREEFFARPLQKDNIVIFFVSERRAQLLKLPDGRARWNRLNVAGYVATRRSLHSSFATQPSKKSNGDEAQSEDSFYPTHGRLDDHAKSYERAVFKALKYVDLKKIHEKTPLVISKIIVSEALLTGTKVAGESFDEIFFNYIKWAKALLAGELFMRNRLGPLGRRGKTKAITCGVTGKGKTPNR